MERIVRERVKGVGIMNNRWFGKFSEIAGGINRRDLFRGGGLLAALGAVRGGHAPAAAATLEIGHNIYQSIGVRPVINCKGTFTIISGSQSLPDVKRAMEEASRHYVNLDDLMEGVGKRLAELTGAEWGIVTAGCAAAITHVTAASIAGCDPEKMQRLPYLQGLKSEVIIPQYSRNVYDHAVRMLGVKVVEARDKAEYEAAFNERTAMVYILAGRGDDGPLGTQAASAIARQKGVPLMVDAAAEVLTIPNVHLQRGATVVGYSGGKCIRGPQCAGLLLGEKNLLQAAWANSAPHHAFGRSLKVGKEEIMGMLAAVEAWTKRDHKAEWAQWEGWLDHIAKQVKQVEGVTAEIKQPDEGLSNRSPRLVIQWDGTRLGITGQEIGKFLLDTEPRIVLGGARGSRPQRMESMISITPYMMTPGDEKVVAERLYALLSKPPKIEIPPVPAGDPANVAGQWQARLEFLRGSAQHTIILEQKGSELVGTHRGEILSGDLHGSVAGSEVHFRSSHKYEGTRLSYEFAGKVDGENMEGLVNLDEYGEARWTAKRHKYA
jgi:D-glucosaminate-6-phosphate ammonia-lyase